MENKKKQPFNTENNNQIIIDSFDYLSNAASSQDCTGLIPSAPTDTAELESYESLYNYLPPEVSPKDKDSDKSREY